MKHVYGILFILLGLTGISMGLLCPIVKGSIAIITFVVGACFLNFGARASGITNDDKSDPL